MLEIKFGYKLDILPRLKHSQTDVNDCIIILHIGRHNFCEENCDLDHYLTTDKYSFRIARRVNSRNSRTGKLEVDNFKKNNSVANTDISVEQLLMHMKTEVKTIARGTGSK